MLELHEPEGAFAAIDTYLTNEGFWGSSGVAADLYLGYGLGRPLRRTRTASPPEPCPLPLAACRVRDARRRAPAAAFSVGEWQRTWSDAGYAAAIESVRAAIARGDVYQVNLVHDLAAAFGGAPSGLAAVHAPLRPLVPEPLAGNGWAVVSASPELFVGRRGRRV